MKMIDLTLPEWTFLYAHSHEGDLLGTRTVILHAHSATVIEILEGEHILMPGVLFYDFSYNGQEMRAVVHYSAKLSITDDRDYILENILIPCANWYKEYCAWEDGNIEQGVKGELN